MSGRAVKLTCISVLLLLAFVLITILFIVPEFKNNTQVSVSHGKPTIIIDAGHGGEDGGAVSNSGIFEKDLNLSIASILCDMLKSDGINVIMTRNEDILLYDRNADFKGRKKALDLKARLDISSDNVGAVFISIHMNAFPQKKYDGLQVYYRIGDKNSEILAKTIQDNVKSCLQPGNLRKPKQAGSNIYLLGRNPNTAILVECGFLSNDEECRKLCDNDYQHKLALVFYGSILKFMDACNESP